MKPLAIFDIDGTIFRSSLTIELFRHLVRRKIFKPRFIKKVRAAEEKWTNRRKSYESYINEVVASYQKAVVGVNKKDVITASKNVMAVQQRRTYRYTLQTLEKIRSKYFTIGISGSPLEIVNEYNKFLRFDKIYGWEFGTDKNGRYTGKVLHVPPLYKKEIITRFVENHGASLKHSIGIGDTESDEGFLDLVDKPVAFNPNLKLAQIAAKKNWTVVLERKDLILELKLNKATILK